MALTTFFTVFKMILFAVPGYILVKSGKVRETSISSFSTMLMYVLQPSLQIYSFQTVTCTGVLLRQLLLTFGIAVLSMGGLLALFGFLFRKKREDVRYRVANVAVCFGNVGFMGIPVMQSVLPGCGEVYVYSAAFFFAMSLMGWTVASAIITRDRKYISAKQIFLNPTVISMVFALALFLLKIRLPEPLFGVVEGLQLMCTPLCMLIMGLRLATADLHKLLTTGLYYVASAVKLFGMPLLVFVGLYFTPLDLNLKSALFVMSCCPVASVVQNFAELIGCGQEDGANMTLLSSFLSVITIPLMVGLFQFN